jgi:uncharacterized protein
MTIPDDLVRVRRAPERASDDRDLIEAILDTTPVCHLGYLHDGRPVVVPTLFGRDEDHLVLHGSVASRAMRAGAAGLPVCVTVTLLDGLVLARSAFHHSANYRSVVVHGDAELVEDPDDKVAALRVLTEHVTPGRWATVRWPSAKELKATTVLRLPLTHAIAKVRGHGVADDADDLDLPVWAGVVPIATTFGPPVADAGVSEDLQPPEVVRARVGTALAGAPAGLTGAVVAP